jgi:Putative adhesin
MLKSICYALAVTAVASPLAFADQWSKSFHVGAAPELRVDTTDANVTLRTGGGTSVEAYVYTSGWRIGPGDVQVIDHQSGDRVEIEVKVPRMHFSFGNRSIKIEVQIPAATKVDVHTGDGNIRADGLRAPAKLVTHDGNIDGEGFDGTLEASSGDGNIHVRGRFNALSLRSGDGNIVAEVSPGSHMSTSWSVHTGDGGVTLRLPNDFSADLDAHTGDGHITVDLPLSTSGGLHEDSVTGKLNGGGPMLTVRTGDGSVRLERL